MLCEGRLWTYPDTGWWDTVCKSVNMNIMMVWTSYIISDKINVDLIVIPKKKITEYM